MKTEPDSLATAPQVKTCDLLKVSPRLTQLIALINETLKGQLDLERHRGRTPDGVAVPVLQRILALTAAIWHNDPTGSTSYAL